MKIVINNKVFFKLVRWDLAALNIFWSKIFTPEQSHHPCITNPNRPVRPQTTKPSTKVITHQRQKWSLFPFITVAHCPLWVNHFQCSFWQRSFVGNAVVGIAWTVDCWLTENHIMKRFIHLTNDNTFPTFVHKLRQTACCLLTTISLSASNSREEEIVSARHL